MTDKSIAVVLFSRRTDMPIQISFTFKTVSMKVFIIIGLIIHWLSKWKVCDLSFNLYYLKVSFTGSSAKIRDLFAAKDLGVFENSFRGLVNPSGVLMLRMIATVVETLIVFNWDIDYV